MEPGDRIDGWVVEGRLGTGGMGSVYRCRNASTERIVAALKVLDRSLRQDQDASTRFVREAEILAGLDHPNIVRVRNVRIDADPPYLEMEFVEGESLDALLRRGPVAYGYARRLMIQAAEAVKYLHAKGVRHRDLKPANVLVDAEGRLRLVDFGLATETSLERITEQGLNFGTVSYAPPEWMDPDHLDPVQWDLYSLGVIFFELLTGRIAFPMSGEGAVKKQLLQVMMHKQVAPPLDPGDFAPEEARRLIADLTRLSPAERPQSAAEVVERFKALPSESERTVPLAERREESTPQPSRPPSPASLLVTIPPPTAGRSRRVLLVGAAVLVPLAALVAVGLAYVLWAGPAGPREPVPHVEPQPLRPATARTVEVRFAGAPEGLPIRAVLGSQTVLAKGGLAEFSGVATRATEVTWVAGEGCDGCPGEACPAACGVGTIPVLEGEGPVSLAVVVKPGTATVTVQVPSVEKPPEAGPFKRKKRWPMTARLDGRPGDPVGVSGARFTGVEPGSHRLVVDVGECPTEAAACWPSGDCPEKCRSEAKEVIVPFDGGDLTARLEVPTP